MSVAYSRLTRDAYGAVLHHNLDKLYLRGGHARTGLGGHEMTEPTILVIGGRVSSSFAGEPIDYRDLFEQVAHGRTVRRVTPLRCCCPRAACHVWATQQPSSAPC